ncbi:Sec-independent protein translocase protein TatB [Sorangium sp. So ce260]|uniref:Sec-independent protein translocase protein TatB n=1 Tax=Sorangium sp. So ce260 TaxID=3133291 RepID=UPI003F5ED0B8
MFGFSFGEMMVLVIVGIIVVGPRRLPAMMRSAGSWIAKLRRMTTELRTQSGIDDLIRQEGLEREIRELRALSRVNVIETLVKPVVDAATVGTVVSATPRIRPPEPEPPPPPPPNVPPLREREYPVLGCDAYGSEIDAAPDGAPRPAAAAEGATGAEAASAAEPAATTAAAITAEPAATTAAAITAGPAAAPVPAATTGAAITAGPAAAPEPAAAPQGAATGNGAAS